MRGPIRHHECTSHLIRTVDECLTQPPGGGQCVACLKTTFCPCTIALYRFGLCRQEVANALDEVALASQQCALLSQQHEATPSNPEPVVDQVRGQHTSVITNVKFCHAVAITCLSD